MASGEAGPGPRGDPLADRPLDEPLASRLGPGHPRRNEIIDAHRAAMAEGEAGYLDPTTGLFVLTAVLPPGPGDVLSGGCRHCPYDV